MYIYDIRNQIRIENKNKSIGEMLIMILLVSITALLILTCQLRNPFVVAKPTSDQELEERMKQGVDYVKFDQSELEFSGYYRMDNKNKIVYNCYTITLDKLKYFVFVPANRSGKDPTNPIDKLSNYSFTARLDKDNELLKMVAREYNLGEKEFLKEYGVSNIILDEVNSDRFEMYALHYLFTTIVIVCLLYLFLSLIQVNEVTRSRQVKELSKYGDIEQILDEINEEVKNNKLYDTGKVKITKHYVAGFYQGNISIFKRADVKKVTVKNDLKRLYYVIPYGPIISLEFVLENNTVHKIYVNSKVEADEMKELF